MDNNTVGGAVLTILGVCGYVWKRWLHSEVPKRKIYENGVRDEIQAAMELMRTRLSDAERRLMETEFETRGFREEQDRRLDKLEAQAFEAKRAQAEVSRRLLVLERADT